MLCIHYAYTNGFAIQHGYIVQYVFSYMIIFKKILHLKKKIFLCVIQKQKQYEQLFIELNK